MKNKLFYLSSVFLFFDIETGTLYHDENEKPDLTEPFELKDYHPLEFFETYEISATDSLFLIQNYLKFDNENAKDAAYDLLIHLIDEIDTMENFIKLILIKFTDEEKTQFNNWLDKRHLELIELKKTRPKTTMLNNLIRRREFLNIFLKEI